MKVVLTADVADLGERGSIVDVSDGYARNYLLPRKLASKATAGNVEAAEKATANRAATERKSRDDAQKLATGLAGTRVVLAAQAGDEGRLYGSVTVARRRRGHSQVHRHRDRTQARRPARSRSRKSGFTRSRSASIPRSSSR